MVPPQQRRAAALATSDHRIHRRSRRRMSRHQRLPRHPPVLTCPHETEKNHEAPGTRRNPDHSRDRTSASASEQQQQQQRGFAFIAREGRTLAVNLLVNAEDSRSTPKRTVKLVGIQQFSGTADRHTDRPVSSDGLFGDLIPTWNRVASLNNLTVLFRIRRARSLTVPCTSRRPAGFGGMTTYPPDRVPRAKITMCPGSGFSRYESNLTVRMVSVVQLFLDIVLAITSVALILLVLLHRAKGGGLSSLFGGSVQSSLSGSTVVEKNLDRITIIATLVWIIAIVGVGLEIKFG